eukprot:gene6920-7698_t
MARNLAIVNLLKALLFYLISCKYTKGGTGVEKMVEEILVGYDNRIIPLENGMPVVCEFSVIISNLADMDPIGNHLTLEALLHQSWIDSRLKTSNGENGTAMPISISGKSTDLIWTPDLVIANEESGTISKVTRKNVFAQISPSGKVTLSQRCLVRIFCKMEYFMYPFDDQMCNITFLSYAYSKTWLRLKWVGLDKDDRVTTSRHVNRGKFRLLRYETKHLLTDFGEYGLYDSLQLQLKLRRKVMPYVMRIYTPLTLIVIMSWVTFWINYRCVPARTSFSVCSVLSIIMFVTSIQSSLPRAGVLRLVDMHIVVCFAYVYAALVEYAVVQSIDIKIRCIEFEELKQKANEEKSKRDSIASMRSTQICNEADITIESTGSEERAPHESEGDVIYENEPCSADENKISENYANTSSNITNNSENNTNKDITENNNKNNNISKRKMSKHGKDCSSFNPVKESINERSSLIRNEIGGQSQNRPVHEDGTRSVSSISRTDEQSLLSRIVHKTADEIIDVSAIEPHSMERSEYMEKMRLYQEKTSGGNIRPPKQKSNLPNILAPMNTLAAEPINSSDIKLIIDSSISVANAITKMEVNAKEPLVVPFGVNQTVVV